MDHAHGIDRIGGLKHFHYLVPHTFTAYLRHQRLSNRVPRSSKDFFVNSTFKPASKPDTPQQTKGIISESYFCIERRAYEWPLRMMEQIM